VGIVGALFETAEGIPVAAATGKDGVLMRSFAIILRPLGKPFLRLVDRSRIRLRILSTPAFDGHTLFVGAGSARDADLEGGSVYAIDPDNGNILWRRLLEGTVIAPVTVANACLRLHA